MRKTIALNLSYDLSDADWRKVVAAYQQMDGWIEYTDTPYWFGTENDERYIASSVTRNGLIAMTGNIDDTVWENWITALCARLSLTLGRKIAAFDPDPYYTPNSSLKKM